MISFPWNSEEVYIGDDGYPVYDRVMSADDLCEVYETFFSNGVFMNNKEALSVTAGEGMTVSVSAGKCNINGTIGVEINERLLQLEAASDQDRIDTVVVRRDANVEERAIDLYVLTGIASDKPVRPYLTRNDTVHELGLCDIFVPKRSTSVSAELITDTRMETDRCGAVTPFAEIDTTTFYNQIQAAIDARTGELEEQTGKAVELAQKAIDETLYGELEHSKVSKNGDTMTGTLSFIATESKIEMESIEQVPYVAIGDNTTNLWIGALGATWRHHKGRTILSTGWRRDEEAAYRTIYVGVPKGDYDAANETTDADIYEVFHGNYLDVSMATHGKLSVSHGGTGVGSLNDLVKALSNSDEWKRVALSSYPVGAVYMSFVNTSPATLMGGTWMQLGDAYVKFSNQSASTGGSSSIKLTVAQLPSHSHSFSLPYDNAAASGSAKALPNTNGASSSSYGAKIGNTGSGSSVSITPYYQSVYAWRRTA